MVNLIDNLVELLEEPVALLLKILELLQLDLVLPLLTLVVFLHLRDFLLLSVELVLHDQVFFLDLLEAFHFI